MITQEVENFMDKVPDDITKITQACTTAQENTGKVMENSITQALTKPPDVTSPYPTIDSRTFGTHHASNSSSETNWTSYWQTNNFGIPQHSNNEVYHSQRHY